MISKRPCHWNVVLGIVTATMLALAGGCSRDELVQLGASQDEVVRQLGDPDRKAVLDGKVLRDLGEMSDRNLMEYQLIYVYDDSGLQVWFKGGKVTGVIRNGVSVY